MSRNRPRGLDRERLALEVRRASRPFAVVLVLVAGVVASASIIFANIGVSFPWSDVYRTRLAVDDASGLVSAKQEVRLAGVVVGRTGDITLEDGQAIVGIKLDGGQGPIYRDARVRVRPETPLEDYYVNIVDRGTPEAGALGPDDVLDAENTRTAVDIGKVLDVFEAGTRGKVEQAIDGYGRGLGDRGAALRATLVELAPFLDAARRLTRETAQRREQTSRLVHNFRLLTEELARRDIALKRFVAAGAGSLGELGDNEAAIAATLAELPPTLTRLQSSFAALRTTADSLDPALDALQPVARALPSALDGLERIGRTGTPALRALRKPLPRLRALAGALRPTARGLAGAFTALRPVPRRLDAVTRLIGPCRPQLQQFFHHTISLGKFADENSVILRGQAVVGTNSAAGQVDDPNQTAPPACTPGGPGGSGG